MSYKGPRWLATGRGSQLRAFVVESATLVPASGRQVRFTLGALIATATTDPSGYATVTVTPTVRGATSLVVDVLSGVSKVASVSSPVTIVAPATSSLVAGLGSGPFDANLSEVDPAGMAARNGLVYIADRVTNAVLRVDRTVLPLRATIVVPATELGTMPTDRPVGLALDATNRLYVSDAANNRVRRLDPITGIVSTIVGTGVAGATGDGGQGITATLNKPSGLIVSPTGALFIADTGNGRVRQLATNGVISTALGTGATGTPGTVTLRTPTALALPRGAKLAVLDEGTSAVIELNTDGTVSTVFSTNRFLSLARGLMTDAGGNLVVSQDFSLTRIVAGVASVALTTTVPDAFSFSSTDFGRSPVLVGEGQPPGAGLAGLGALYLRRRHLAVHPAEPIHRGTHDHRFRRTHRNRPHRGRKAIYRLQRDRGSIGHQRCIG